MSETLVGGGAVVDAPDPGRLRRGAEVLMGGIAPETDSIEEVTM
jgi:hypothetical protein